MHSTSGKASLWLGQEYSRYAMLCSEDDNKIRQHSTAQQHIVSSHTNAKGNPLSLLICQPGAEAFLAFHFGGYAVTATLSTSPSQPSASKLQALTSSRGSPTRQPERKRLASAAPRRDGGSVDPNANRSKTKQTTKHAKRARNSIQDIRRT